MTDRKRRKIGARERLEVLKRDNYRCAICGRSPAITPGVQLEVDHYQPFSTGGADEPDNFQTLCDRCNRGKGDRAELNKSITADLEALLDQINPAIRAQLDLTGSTGVVANQEDYAQLLRLNAAVEPSPYRLQPTTNSAFGYRAGDNSGLGIYTLVDYGGAKSVFVISSIPRRR